MNIFYIKNLMTPFLNLSIAFQGDKVLIYIICMRQVNGIDKDLCMR